MAVDGEPSSRHCFGWLPAQMYNNSLFGGSSKIYLFILFNDCLIYGTRPGRLLSGNIKHVLPLVGMSLDDERVDETKKVKNGQER